METGSVTKWASETFGRAQLKDVRRARRLVAMAEAAARRPSGKVAMVFDRDEERAGAYDFLENPAIKADALATVLFETTAARARAGETVYVVIDGTTLTLTDRKERKELGRVGSPNRAARGIQVMNAFAVAGDGVPLGLVDQIYWVRDELETMPKNDRTARNQQRPFEEKECANFVRAAERAIERLSRAAVRVCVVIDREADNTDILFALSRLDCDFIVRARYDRKRVSATTLSLRETLGKRPVLGRRVVDVNRTGQRAARNAEVELRSHGIFFDVRSEGTTREAGRLVLNAVSVKELESSGTDALDWMLLTNLAASTFEAASKVIDGYRKRWRIEEFHRTWKQGDCNVEDAQLHSLEALRKWALILAAVAMRIERLKYLARTTPDAPATIELSSEEITVLKRDQASRGVKKKRAVPASPTLEEVTRWIGQLGGWIDQKGNGPPGATTIARGFERLSVLVHASRSRKSSKPGAELS